MDSAYGGGPTGQGQRAAESDVQAARDQKHTAMAYGDVTNLRKKAAEHRREAAKFFAKSRKEELKAVKLSNRASEARREADVFVNDSKFFDAKAAELEQQFHAHTGDKLEKAYEKKAKYLSRSAKLLEKASKKREKATALENEALVHTTKSKEFLEKSNLNKAEETGLLTRAEALERAIHEQLQRK